MAFPSSLPLSLSPLSSVSWSSPVRVASLGWCSSSRSVLVFVDGSPVPLTCRVGSDKDLLVTALVAMLRLSRDTGALVRLATRSGWSSSEWFCGAMLSEDEPGSDPIPVPDPVEAWFVEHPVIKN